MFKLQNLSIFLLYTSFFQGVVLHGQENNNCKDQLAEKVFVHLNQDVYINGGILSYKVYLIQSDQIPAEKGSNIVYFELTDYKNNIVHAWQTILKNNTANASIVLPDSLKSALYTLTAYTNWMRNYPQGYCFKKPVLIYAIEDEDFSGYLSGMHRNKFIVKAYQSDKDSLKVYYKISDSFLTNDSVLITILDKHDSVRAISKPDRLGFGTVIFKSNKNSHYKLKVGNNPGMVSDISLSQTEDFSLIIKSDAEDYIEVELLNHNNRVYADQLYLRIESAGQVKYEKKPDAFAGKNTIKIPKKYLSPGINSLKVFDRYSKELGQTFYYHYTSDGLINILCKEEYTKGEDVSLDLKLPQPESFENSQLSVSVSEISPFNYSQTNLNIRDYTLFFSEFGNLEHRDIYPGYENHIIYLSDTLQYFWDSLPVKAKQISDLKEWNYSIIKGTVTVQNTRQPLAHKLIMASYQGNTARFDYTFTNDAGKFIFAVDSSYNNKIVILQLPEIKKADINIDWEFEEKQVIQQGKSFLYKYQFSEEQIKYLADLRKKELVERVYNQEPEDYKEKELSEISRNFFYSPTDIIRPDEYEELNNFAEICDNIIPFVRFRKEKENYSLKLVLDDRTVAKDNILVFLNGVPFSNMDYLATLSSDDIEWIEIFNEQIFHGDLTFNGVMAIYTNTRSLAPGYFNTPVFFLVNKVPEIYPLSIRDNKDMPKISPVIYWNPDIVLQGKVDSINIKFKTGNINSDYRIVVNGLTESGKILYGEKIFSVK